MAVLGTLSFAAAAGGQEAGNAAPADSGMELTLATGVRWLELPDVRAGLDAPSSPAGKTEDAVGAGLDATLSIPLAAPFGGFGERARVLARTRFLWADAKEDENVSAYGQMPVNGAGASNGGSANEAISKLEYDRYDVDFVYEVALGGDGALRKRARVGAGYAHVGHELEFFAQPFNGFRIEDEIATNYYGAVLGFGFGADMPWGLELAADVDVDLLAADSELDVRQQFGGPTLRADDDDVAFAARIRPALGTTYRLGFATGAFDAMIVGLRVSGEWSSYLPSVEHAVRDSNPFASRLDDDDAWAVGGDATLTFLF